ncbi:MAG: hypothetical protein OXN83_02870 [Oligoflexia bacterium]|nr:hypothetical protein [Oligoflexia bacterium]
MLKNSFFSLFFFMTYVQAEVLPSEESLVAIESPIEEETDLNYFQSLSAEDKNLVENNEFNLNESVNDVEAFWNTNYELKRFSSRSSIDTLVKIEFLGRLKWQLIDTLSIYTKGLIVGRSGHTQFIYDRSDRSGGFHLLEFFFQWSAFPNFSFLHGIIEQSFLSAPLLVTDKTFPSVIGEWSVDYLSDFDLKFLLQLAIASNFTEKVERILQLQEAPLFLTSSLFLDSQNNFFDVSIEEKLTVFHYYNLPPDVANRSRIYGNTIDGLSNNSVFRHSFFGVHNNLGFQKIFSDLWALSTGVEFIYNVMAPEAYNEGVRVYGSVYHNYKETMEIKLTGELFANQSDTSVAYYNSETYGHNNRRGVLARLENHFFRSGLTVETEFVYSEPINFAEQSTIKEAYSFSIALKTNDLAI